MSRITYLVPVLAISLTACASELPSGLAQFSKTAQFAAVSPDRPIKGSCDMRIQAPTPVSPGVIRQVDAGNCQISHLGASTILSDKIINMAAGTQTTQITFTAANGDLLYASGSGTSSMVAPRVIRFTANVTFTGGTGRFAQASGQATITGQANPAAGQSAMVMEGSVNF